MGTVRIMVHFPSSEEKRPMPPGSRVSLCSLQLQEMRSVS